MNAWGLSSACLYYKAKRDEQDCEVKKQILIVLGLNPSYGHKRIALEFGLNNKRIRRCMRKFGIKPYRRRAKKLRKKDDEGKVPIFLHSDQESEYDAKAYEEYVLGKGMIISMSHKSSPWENAF